MANEAPVLDPKTGQPVTTPPTTPPKEEPKLTKDQLDGVQKFAHSFLPEKFAAPKTETPEQKAAREKAEKEKATKPAKPKVPARKPTPPSPLTVDQIAEAAARGVATAMGPKKEEPKTEEPTVDFSDEEKETITTLERMEKLYPDKYKGVTERYKKAKPELRKYAEQWEKDHPGETFDENDSQHDDWYKANEPTWEDAHYTKAMVAIAAEASYEAERKALNERLSVFERKEKLREAEPEIAKTQAQPARLLWSQMGEEFKDLVDAAGNLNMEKAIELKKSDPLTFPTRWQAATALNTEVAELYKVMNGFVDFDAKNPVHANISAFAADQESKLANKPIEDRINAEGKDFLPAADYFKLPKSKRGDYWTFSVQDVAALRATHLADLTKNLLDIEEKKHQAWAEARGFTKGASPSTPPTSPKEQDEPPPESTDDKPLSPSASPDSRLNANRRGTGGAAPDPGLTFLQRQLGKK